jgi:putative glycosyltransferase
VVTTMYQSAPFLQEFHERVVAAARQVTDDFEVVFVDDGSPDDSITVARGIMATAAHDVRIVELSRNFGHYHAILAGLEHADGDMIFLIDCDLEDPPEMLMDLRHAIAAAPESDPIDVTYGVQRRRKGRLWERITGAVFYALINAISEVKIPADVTLSRLMTRRYVAALLQHREREMFILGIMTLAGFRQEPVQVDKGSKATTTYTFLRKLSVVLKAVASFSDRPLTFIFALGTAVTALAACVLIFVLVSVLVFEEHYLSGWPSLLALTSLFGGVTLASIGVIGFYLGRVLLEVKHRPTIVKQVESNDPARRVPADDVALRVGQGTS